MRMALSPEKREITREDFWQKPKKERDVIKRTSYFVAATFAEPESKRLVELAKDFNLVCLDVDSSEDAERILADLTKTRAALAPLSFAIYLTAHSTKDAPRLRIVTHADTLPIHRYPDAVQHIATKVGLTRITSESKVVVQPMYRPIVFQGDDIEEHPVVVAEYRGRPLQEKDLPMVEYTGESEVDPLAYLKPPVEAMTPDRARTMLASIDPDCPRPTWIIVGAGLKHQFDDEVAFELWDEWSAGGGKYEEGDSLKQWRSIKASPNKEHVTIRSAMRIASEAGWQDTDIAAEEFTTISRWLHGADAHALLSEGAGKIAQTTSLSSMESTRLTHIFHECLKARGEKLTISEVKKFISIKKREMMRTDSLPKWAKDIVYIARDNEFFRLGSQVGRTTEVLNNLYSRELMAEEEGAEKGKPSLLPSDYLLNVMKIRRLEGYSYRPDQPSAIVKGDDGRYANTYTPPTYELDDDKAAEAGAMLIKHVELLIAEPEYQSILLDWVAYQIQHPGKKIMWAVLLQSAQGAGKSLLFGMFQALLGFQNTSVLEATTLIESPFSAWAAGSQLVCVEELFPTNHIRNEAAERIKSYITSERVEVHRKGKDPYEVPNVTNYLLLTNHVDALRLTPTERRYFVLHSRLNNQKAVSEVDPSHYDEFLEKCVRHPGALAAWLKRRDLSNFNPYRVERTKYFYETCEAARSSLDIAMSECFENPSGGVHPEAIAPDMLRKRLMDEGAKATLSGVQAVLRQQGYTRRGRVRYGGDRVTLWARKSDPREDQDLADLWTQAEFTEAAQ